MSMYVNLQTDNAAICKPSSQAASLDEANAEQWAGYISSQFLLLYKHDQQLRALHSRRRREKTLLGDCCPDQMSKDENVKPNHITFSTLLPNDDKRTAAVHTVFETAKECGQVRPLVIQRLQAVLPAADFSILCLQHAIQTYKEMLKDENVEPNHITFSTFLTALRNLLPNDDKRTAAVHEVFKTQSTQNWIYFLSTTVPTEDEKQLGQCS